MQVTQKAIIMIGEGFRGILLIKLIKFFQGGRLALVSIHANGGFRGFGSGFQSCHILFQARDGSVSFANGCFGF